MGLPPRLHVPPPQGTAVVARERAYALVLSHLVRMVGLMASLGRLRASALRPAAGTVTEAHAGPGS